MRATLLDKLNRLRARLRGGRSDDELFVGELRFDEPEAPEASAEVQSAEKMAALVNAYLAGQPKRPTLKRAHPVKGARRELEVPASLRALLFDKPKAEAAVWERSPSVAEKAPRAVARNQIRSARPPSPALPLGGGGRHARDPVGQAEPASGAVAWGPV